MIIKAKHRFDGINIGSCWEHGHPGSVTLGQCKQLDARKREDFPRGMELL